MPVQPHSLLGYLPLNHISNLLYNPLFSRNVVQQLSLRTCRMKHHQYSRRLIHYIILPNSQSAFQHGNQPAHRHANHLHNLRAFQVVNLRGSRFADLPLNHGLILVTNPQSYQKIDLLLSLQINRSLFPRTNRIVSHLPVRVFSHY